MSAASTPSSVSARPSRALASKAAAVALVFALALAAALSTWAFAEEGARAGSANTATEPATPATNAAVVTLSTGSTDIATIVEEMTLDEKISQMIIPAIRSWNGTDVTDLSAAPELASALRAHQYGGVILYGQNVVGTEQTARLVSALQVNNAQIPASTNIPYFTPVDEEGGIVLRLSMGTRMTGNMALGATGANALRNARATGQVLGEECAALGFNIDYAPDVDVNNNPANPVIGTRSFSDDPAKVGPLGNAYGAGLKESNVIATYKHFPGHGDTGVDSHIGTPSVEKTYSQLKATELVPFQSVIDAGADMIMTAHITYPLVDDQVVYGDGVTKGYYPATMSKKMIQQILRTDMGFDGVVVTDALEMDAIRTAGLVPGAEGSAEYGANIAEKVINAGVDILLLPTDLKSADAAQFYDDYIALLCQKVEDGTIPLERVDESVTRILKLKQKYGILDMDTSGSDIDNKVAAAMKVVGSASHHAKEKAIAEQAITLVKNEGLTLPLCGHGSKTVIVGRDAADNTVIAYALAQLQKAGALDKDAFINNLAAGTQSGSSSSATRVTIGSYFDPDSGELAYSSDLKAAIAQANNVVCLSRMSNLTAYQPDGAIYQGVSAVMNDAHAAGAKFTLLSCNLPYDAARFNSADAIVLAYMASGAGVDPTERTGGGNTVGAYNANIIAAIETLFDNVAPTGTLPVNIPAITTAADGTVSYSNDVLYPRGFGLNYQYRFTEGMNGVHESGASAGLSFRTNARYDKLVRILVDGKQVDPKHYTAGWCPTRLQLSADFLNTLSAGEHTLQAVYDYNGKEVVLETKFTVKAASTPGQTTPNPKGSAVSPTAKTADAAPAAALMVLAALMLAAATAARRRSNK